MSSHSDRTAPAHADAAHDEKRRLLCAAIEQHQEDLFVGVRVLLWQVRLAPDRERLTALAGEVLQETIARALAAASNYNPAWSATAWLLGVAHNVIRHLRRDSGSKQRLILVADVPQVRRSIRFPKGMTEEEMFDLLRNPDTVRAAEPSALSAEEILSTVGESDREILRLRYVEGLSGKELAARLRISEGAAGVRLSRARTKLRSAFLSDEK